MPTAPARRSGATRSEAAYRESWSAALPKPTAMLPASRSGNEAPATAITVTVAPATPDASPATRPARRPHRPIAPDRTAIAIAVPIVPSALGRPDSCADPVISRGKRSGREGGDVGRAAECHREHERGKVRAGGIVGGRAHGPKRLSASRRPQRPPPLDPHLRHIGSSACAEQGPVSAMVGDGLPLLTRGYADWWGHGVEGVKRCLFRK